MHTISQTYYVEVVSEIRVHYVQLIGIEFRVGEFIFGGFRCIEYIKKTARIFCLRCLILKIFMGDTQNYLRNNYKIHNRIKYKCFQIIKPSLYKEFSVKHM
jgi:hypothetical protein